MSHNVCCGPEPTWKGPAPVFFFKHYLSTFIGVQLRYNVVFISAV